MQSTVTILELAEFRGAKEDENHCISAEEFYKVGLDIMGGCCCCHATIAAYNAYPTKNGFWACSECVDDTGWTDVKECNRDIFAEELEASCDSKL